MALTGVRVLVVGAGIIGRSTAYFLARQGAKVVLLDEGIPAGSPTSRASLGVLTHCNGGDNPYAQLFRDGHALHARLARDLAEDVGADVGWRPLGGIDLFADPSQLEEVWRFNRERGCRVERLDEQAMRDAEPGVGRRRRGAVFCRRSPGGSPQVGRGALGGGRTAGRVCRLGRARLAHCPSG